MVLALLALLSVVPSCTLLHLHKASATRSNARGNCPEHQLVPKLGLEHTNMYVFVLERYVATQVEPHVGLDLGQVKRNNVSLHKP